MSLTQVDQQAPEVRLEDERGDARLSDYWSEGSAVLIFLRHFG